MKSFCGYLFSLFRGECLGVESLGQRVDGCLTSWEAANVFSKVVVLVLCSHRQRVRVPSTPQPCQHSDFHFNKFMLAAVLRTRPGVCCVGSFGKWCWVGWECPKGEVGHILRQVEPVSPGPYPGSSSLPEGSVIFSCQITSGRLPDPSQPWSRLVVGFCVGPVQGGGVSLQVQVSVQLCSHRFFPGNLRRSSQMGNLARCQGERALVSSS